MRLPRRVAAAFAHPLAPYAFALALQLVFVGYVKDDAYIEYRYATNLAHGHGLVFNAGEPPVEGFTSFLWTLGLALPALLHLPLLAVAKLVGAAALVGTIALVARWVRLRGGDAGAVQLGRWLVATNASLVVWAQSGMEMAVTPLVVLAAFVALEQRRHARALALAFVAAGMRPECHLVLLAVAAVALGRGAWRPVVVAVLALAALHGARFAYYGSLVPNTALVKAGRFEPWNGLAAAGELAVTSLAIVPILLALATAARRRDAVSLAAAALLLGFIAYVVRIGRDEMFLARLYLPVWPLALALAAPPLTTLWRWRPPLGALVPLAIVGCGIGFTAGRLHTIHYRELGERSHVVLAEMMKQRAQPGDLVLFQDVGQTPWAAMELRFLDPIGLTDRTIARLRWSEHVSPFAGQPSARTQAAIRDYIFARNPRLVALVAYVNGFGPATRAAYERVKGDPAAVEQLFAYFVAGNGYHVGLTSDPRFRARYRFVDVVRRKDDYWFVLYERRPDSIE